MGSNRTQCEFLESAPPPKTNSTSHFKGEVDPEDIDLQNPLGFLSASTVSLPEVVYRFCRDEPGVHVVLSGTGNPEHVAANVASFDRPPLPEAGV